MSAQRLGTYYNEIDRYCCDWLSNLMDAGLITPGKIDDRSIEDLGPDDVRGYERVHFFAGIAGWDLALQLAGWPATRSIWTGSCPCQPFSAAGKGKAADDERHLWPCWFRLIRAVRPPEVIGEQVEAAIGWGWLDLVYDDLGAEGYAVGSAVLPACGVGAPHIRNRLWFVGHAQGGDGEIPIRQWRSRQDLPEPRGASGASDLADLSGPRRWPRGYVDADLWRDDERRQAFQSGRLCATGELADTEPQFDWSGDGRAGRRSEPADCSVVGDADKSRLQGRSLDAGKYADQRALGVPGHWSDIEWIACSDGKARPTQSGLFPLAYGVSGRVGKLRAYGNAIVPQAGAAFIKAFLEAEADSGGVP